MRQNVFITKDYKNLIKYELQYTLRNRVSFELIT